MTGIIVRMVREFPATKDAHSWPVHARVFPSGEIEPMGDKGHGRASQEVAAVNAKHARAGSQLLTIRMLSLYGWRVSDPTLWEEAEA